VHRTLAEPAIRRRLAETELDVATSSPADFEALIARDADAWDTRVRKGLIKPA